MATRRKSTWIANVAGGPAGFGGQGIARQLGWMPRIDLLESESQVIIRAELAGVAPGAVTVSYSSVSHAIVIKGERSQDRNAHALHPHPHIIEIEEGPFAREIPLPVQEVDLSGVTMRFKNGILTISVPKAEKRSGVFVVETITITKV